MDFKLIITLLFTSFCFSQLTIKGSTTTFDGKPIDKISVFNTTNNSKTTSDELGNFVLNVDQEGTYTVLFYKEGFALQELNLKANTDNNRIILEKVNQLSEVVINKQREKVFALNQLRDIEETAIYAGRKTEVVSVAKLTANKATNNARQIFAQVAGLTINESSDGGLQLSIGGRGLNPNRTSNFNTRQNDYDISADVLGYPESYYATPTEALKEIQVVRGAASLQYGTQFGGLVNFKIYDPSSEPFEIVTRNTVGSFGLYTNFTSLSGTKKKFSYYTFFNYKEGNGFRANSEFNSRNYFANLNYQFNSNTSIHLDYTHFYYLAQQAGGLTDAMFAQDPNQSNRTRNWFAVNWNLFALRFKHKFDNTANFSLQLFGLDASRKSVGFRSNRVSSPDSEGNPRDLINGDFVNWGLEARYLKKYQINGKTNAFLIGTKYYQSRNTNIQGAGSSKSDADFSLANDEFPLFENQSNYVFPNLNIAFFGENIFKITDKFTVTPGFRAEKIKTQSQGSYRRINLDLAGNVILDENVEENTVKDRNLFLLGVGLSYKANKSAEFYGNVSQNYRSVTFNDIRTVNPSQVIAENITDEKGFTSDIGIRGQFKNKLKYDASIFGLLYQDKIGEYLRTNPNGSAALVRYRDNIGTALTYGFESVLDWSLSNTFLENNETLSWNVFTNLAITSSEYLKSDVANIKGNKVEFVPLVNLKTGTSFGYKNFMTSVQLTYVTSQYTEATNSKTDTTDNLYGIFGEIPTYYVADFSASYKWKNFKLEAGITNFTNNNYFTRRATGYPGPGIIPSDLRTFYSTLEFQF
jgi:Fe(3+) dicitrate transport protein